MATHHRKRSLGSPVESKSAGMRLDVFLAKHFLFLSRSGWQKKIKKGEVYLGDRVARHHEKIRVDDQIYMHYDESHEPDVQTTCEILYQDEEVLALNKPSGLAMHCHGPYFKNTVHQFLLDRFGSGWNAVHRLDVETSGVLLAARTFAGRQNLSMQFQNNQIRKKYAAVVFNPTEQNAWENNQKTGDLKESLIRIKRWVTPTGQDCFTRFRMLKKNKHGLVLAEPKTGRTNQIRIHLAVDGMHLLGDKLYYPDEGVFIEYHEHGLTQNVLDCVLSPRLMLHAWQIKFTHPLSGRALGVFAPLPLEFKKLFP